LIWQRVRISGLVSKPEYNDATGRVLAHSAETGRYQVALWDRMGSQTSQVLALKPDNVAALPRDACAVCGQRSDAAKPLRCSRCTLVHYCSAECQAAAWPSHKQTCIAKSDFDAKVTRLQSEGNGALQTGVPSEARRAAALFVEAAAACEARRVPLDASSAAWRELWASESDMRAMGAQCLLRSNVSEALDQAVCAVSAARHSGDTTKLVDRMTTHATVLLRAAAESNSKAQLLEARAELVQALAICEQSRQQQQQQQQASDDAASDHAAGSVIAAVRQCPMVLAEAVTRSALGRALFALDDHAAAEEQFERAVALRRENLRLRNLIGAREPNHVSVLAEAHRQLASTLINFGGFLSASTSAGRADGAKAATTRAVLGEALTLARLSGDVSTEQAALTQLVNSQPKGETTDAAAALKELLARTGRAVDATCCVCLEALGESDLFALNCGHVMHKQCVMRWREHSNACPQCKRAISG
jgi:tetratricopeptide (TPR) repeat protein